MSLKTQHKPKRDGQKARELADYKRENNQLRRTVARLRKELDNSYEAEAEAAELQGDYGIPDKPVCPDCKSKNISVFETPNSTKILVCTFCSWKKNC